MPIKITSADENRNILLYTKKPDFPNQFSIFLDLEKYSIENGAEFHHIPVTEATKEDAEKELLRLITTHNIDFVVLARYMQILSENICNVSLLHIIFTDPVPVLKAA